MKKFVNEDYFFFSHSNNCCCCAIHCYQNLLLLHPVYKLTSLKIYEIYTYGNVFAMLRLRITNYVKLNIGIFLITTMMILKNQIASAHIFIRFSRFLVPKNPGSIYILNHYDRISITNHRCYYYYYY